MLIALRENLDSKREVYNQLDSEYQSKKSNLEVIKQKQDELMTEIQDCFKNTKINEDGNPDNFSYINSSMQGAANSSYSESLNNELDSILMHKSSLKSDMSEIESQYINESNSIMSELDSLTTQIIEKKKVYKAFKIQEELINLRINPMKSELNELLDTRRSFEDNLNQVYEVELQ